MKKEEAPQVDKTALEAAVEEARALKAEDYKTMTWHPFAGALKSAEKVLADAKADQKAVDAAAKALADAKAGLKPVEKVAFVDVDEETSHRAEVEWLAANGVTKGWPAADGAFEFRPYATVKRADMAAFLYRLAGEPAFDAKDVAFTDVDEKTPHRDAILWLASEGISTGYEGADGKAEFRPYAEITRSVMAAFLYRMADELPVRGQGLRLRGRREGHAAPRGRAVAGRLGISTGWTAGQHQDVPPLRPDRPLRHGRVPAAHGGEGPGGPEVGNALSEKGQALFRGARARKGDRRFQRGAAAGRRPRGRGSRSPGACRGASADISPTRGGRLPGRPLFMPRPLGAGLSGGGRAPRPAPRAARRGKAAPPVPRRRLGGGRGPARLIGRNGRSSGDLPETRRRRPATALS